MKQAKRILSFLMAIVIMSSFVNMYAGAKAPYKDSALPSSQYNDLDKPVLTLNQSASVLLDYVDKFLSEKNLILDMGALGTVNLTSVDNILNGIYGIGYSPLFTVFPPINGDLYSVDFSSISTCRRASTPAATADINVIYSIIQFCSDNKEILCKIIDGSLNMGAINSFVDLSAINVNKTIKEALFKAAYPGTAVPEAVAETADTMVQQILVNLLTGSAVPQLAGHVDLNSSASAYDFIDELLQNIYNLYLVSLMNGEMKKAVREFCGVVYGDPAYPDGDETNLNRYAAFFDIDYVVPAHTFAPGTTLVSELNSILGGIAAAVIPGYTGWAAGDNTLVLNNLASAAKYVLKNTDSGFFEDYVAKATDAEIDAMTNQQLFSYLVRSVLNSVVDTMNIPADADTPVEVVWYAVKEILAEKVPRNDYSAQPKTLDGVLYMLADIGVYYLNRVADMNPAAGTTPGEGLLAYGQGFDMTLTAVMNWFRTNYGGLLNLTLSDTDGWAALDTLVFSIIPANWLPASVGGSTKELIKNRIFGDILDLNTSGLFALFDRVAGNDLSGKTIKKVILETTARVFNLVFPGALKSTYTTLDVVVNNTELKVVAENVLAQLYIRRLSILPVAVPLLASAMDTAVPEEYVNPSLILPNCINSATTFTIRNNSTGINTGATDKNGTFTQDSLYKIEIKSITSNIPAITPTNLAGTVINGGDSVNCTLSGTFAANQVLQVTMTYDVYTELGAKLTAVPLTTMAFSYISPVVDDGLNDIKLDLNSANTHSLKYKNIYCNQDYNLADLAAQDQFVINRATTSATDNNYVATVTRTSAAVNATLIANGITAAGFSNISTTYDGGSWNIAPFVVDSAAARPADGAYLSTFVYIASKTHLIKTAETFTVPHYVVFYDDFGLPGLIESELNANRDPADYSDSAAWDDYILALQNAVAVQYKPRTASNFMATIAPAYEDAVLMLNETISALEASALAGDPWAVVPQVIDTFNPPNPPDMSYDDPAYNYFGMADYVPYTYLNYQREVDNCRALLSAQQQIKQIDVAYALHRLNLYAGRMIRVQADKSRLSEDLAAIQAAGPVRSQYKVLSWAIYQQALNFAETVNAQSAAAVDGSGEYILRQTKVDTAREKLVEAYKKLVLVCDYTQLDDLIAIAKAEILPYIDHYTPEWWAIFIAAYNAAMAVPLQMSKTPKNQAKIDEVAAALYEIIYPDPFPPPDIVPSNPDVKIGLPGHPSFLAGLEVGVGAANCVISSEGGFLLFNNGPGGPGTGAAVTLFKNSGVLFKVYITIIFGDVNGDANITGLDAGLVVNAENYLVNWDSATGAAMKTAGDVNGDGNVTGADAGIMVNIENFAQDIDQSTGTVS